VYADVMLAYAERIQATWADGTTIDIAQEMLRLTMGIAGKTFFDADVLEEARELATALNTALHHIVHRSTSLVHLVVAWPSQRERTFRRAIARLDATIYRLIRERHQSSVAHEDLLSLLLHARDDDAGTVMTDRQVRDEAMTLFFAGHETMATALAWTWYLLARHPEIYGRMCAEVDDVLAGRPPTPADLPMLPYTLQVFKEAMRLYPPVYILMRTVKHPIEVGRYELTPGTTVGVSPYVLHRRADHFADAEHFDPDRFAPESEARLPRYAYLPFGAGPHSCLGNHFALLEGHLILAALTQRVTFDLVAGQFIEPEPVVTLRPKGGIKVVVRRRAPGVGGGRASGAGLPSTRPPSGPPRSAPPPA
jgi:cytochrome P450